jgi:hypothetical protein
MDRKETRMARNMDRDEATAASEAKGSKKMATRYIKASTRILKIQWQEKTHQRLRHDRSRKNSRNIQAIDSIDMSQLRKCNLARTSRACHTFSLKRPR